MEIPKSTSASPMHPIDQKLNTSEESLQSTTYQKQLQSTIHRRHKVARYPQRRRSKNRQKLNSKRKYKFKDTQRVGPEQEEARTDKNATAKSASSRRRKSKQRTRQEKKDGSIPQLLQWSQ
jgi:hypothetical protein